MAFPAPGSSVSPYTVWFASRVIVAGDVVVVAVGPMFTSSAIVGMLPVLQLVPMFQLPPLPAIQLSAVAATVRFEVAMAMVTKRSATTPAHQRFGPAWAADR